MSRGREITKKYQRAVSGVVEAEEEGFEVGEVFGEVGVISEGLKVDSAGEGREEGGEEGDLEGEEGEEEVGEVGEVGEAGEGEGSQMKGVWILK